VNAAIDLI